MLLLGGTSEIGLATVDAMSLAGSDEVVLAGRDLDALAVAGSRLLAQVSRLSFDAREAVSRREVLAAAFAAGPVDVLIVAFGILGDQGLAEIDPGHAEEVIAVDFLAQAGIAQDAAARLLGQGSGALVLFSSIAAVRPRRPNYVYGAAKAGLDAFARGLADRLHGSGVRLVLVRPGFVIGRMTAGLAPAPLSTTPTAVGAAVAEALVSGRQVVWVPPSLRALAAAMHLVPRSLWRRVPR
ncbi:MAG: SDR family NAD(P)-dependent oxidoreductase [Mycobacteriales bacterium]